MNIHISIDLCMCIYIYKYVLGEDGVKLSMIVYFREITMICKSSCVERSASESATVCLGGKGDSWRRIGEVDGAH